MSISEKTKGILTKKRKLNKWLMFSILAIILVMLGFLAIGAMSKYGNEKYSREQRSVPYMLGKGWQKAYDSSESELTKEIREEIDCCISIKKFKIFLIKQREYSVEDLAKYNSKNFLTEEENKEKNKEEEYLVLLDRIEKILSDLK
jgi:hypothetical protein